VTPVDFAARALVYLSLHAGGSAPNTFHLTGGQPVTLADLAVALERAGITLEEVDAATWQERADGAARGGRGGVAGAVPGRCRATATTASARWICSRPAA